MDNFAFIIHPLDPKQDVARKYPLLARILPKPLIHYFSRFWPPLYISHITGVCSAGTGKTVEGWLVACPFTARQMLRLPPQVVYDKIVQTGHLAQGLGARVLGLGAFASVVGDGGVTIAKRLSIPVTTGHSLTVALVVDALKAVSLERGVELEQAVLAVVGASGSIGLACAESLAPLVKRMVLVGRRQYRLEDARGMVEAAGASEVSATTDINDISGAELVLSATSSTTPIIYPQHLKRNAIVCDVALPSDLAPEVEREREDIAIIEGGIVDIPGDVDFGFDFGLPPGKAYACMAEVMVLALEGRYESYSLGKKIQGERVSEIAHLAHKHGFRLEIRS